MLTSVRSPRKFGLSYLVINVPAAIMTVVFLQTIGLIKAAMGGNNFNQSIHAQVLTLETALLRQTSQTRSFFVTVDSAYRHASVIIRNWTRRPTV